MEDKNAPATGQTQLVLFFVLVEAAFFSSRRSGISRTSPRRSRLLATALGLKSPIERGRGERKKALGENERRRKCEVGCLEECARRSYKVAEPPRAR